MDQMKQVKPFFKNMPKIDVHNHINGCIRRQTLKELVEQKGCSVDMEEFAQIDMKQAFKLFSLIHQVVTNIQDIKRVTREVLEDFKSQNALYLEIRSTPKSCPKKTFTQKDYEDAILEEIDTFSQANPGMIVRLILGIDRALSVENAWNVLELAKGYQTNKYVIGIDYSGNPYKNTFKMFQPVFEEARKQGLKITVHTAELPGEECYKETLDILQFRPDRLGHFNFHDEKLIKIVQEAKIPIEACPTSNFYTMNLKSMKEHHFDKFFNQLNHPISINCDDTVMFDSVSMDYQQIAEAFGYDTQTLRRLLLSECEQIFDKSVVSDLQHKVNAFFDALNDSK